MLSAFQHYVYSNWGIWVCPRRSCLFPLRLPLALRTRVDPGLNDNRESPDSSFKDSFWQKMCNGGEAITLLQRVLVPVEAEQRLDLGTPGIKLTGEKRLVCLCTGCPTQLVAPIFSQRLSGLALLTVFVCSLHLSSLILSLPR